MCTSLLIVTSVSVQGQFQLTDDYPHYRICVFMFLISFDWMPGSDFHLNCVLNIFVFYKS